MSRAIFAAYKGDRFIAEGTSRELAKTLGVKVGTVYFYRSPAYARRGSGKIVWWLSEWRIDNGNCKTI